jgi:hypothetical protein
MKEFERWSCIMKLKVYLKSGAVVKTIDNDSG